jgi:transposase
MKSISPTTSIRVVNLLSSDHSIRQIAQITGLGKSTICEIKHKHQVNVENQHGGRPRLISSPTRRHLTRKIKTGEVNTVPEATKMLTNQLSINCSKSTVRRTLKKSGLNGRKKSKKPLLKFHHRQDRLAFAQKYVEWTVEDWKRVLWSDETKICLFGPDGSDWIWKSQEEGLNKRTTQATVKHGGGNIMVWGCFSWSGTGMLLEIEGKMNKEQYRDILEEGVVASFEKLGIKKEERIFQQDNDPKHTSKLVQSYFKTQSYDVLDWPAQSPDLNPIEHLWSQVKNAIYMRSEKPKGVFGLWQCLEEEWAKITPEQCHNLVESMPRRCAAVIKAKGSHTKY